MKITTEKYFIENNKYRKIFLFGVVFFVLSNTYFGWNTEAQSGAERVCDFIWNIGVFGGGFGWMVKSMVKEVIFEELGYKVTLHKK